MNLSLRIKLLGAFAINLVLMIGLGIFALSQINAITDKAALVGTNIIPSMVRGNEISAILAQYRISTYRHIANADQGKKTEYQAVLAGLEARMPQVLAAYKPLMVSEVEKSSFAAIEDNWPTYVAATQRDVLPVSRQGEQSAALTALQGSVTLYDQQLVKPAEAIVQDNQAQSHGRHQRCN